MNGSVTTLTKGATLKGASTLPDQDSELTRDLVSYIPMGGPPADASAAASVVLPEATGRDNKYHQYFATITPNPGVNGDVIVSVKQFADNVKPLSKEYVPLTPEQRIAVTLTTPQKVIRDARVANETLTVTVECGCGYDIRKSTRYGGIQSPSRGCLRYGYERDPTCQ